MKIFDFRLMAAAGLFALNATAFEATMTIQPPLIELSGAAVLSIEVRGAKKLQPPALPNVPGLRFVSAGQSQQTSWINGKSDSFTAFNFQIYPQQTGDFTIGPFEYSVDGETRILQGELKVLAAAGDTAQPQSWSEIVFARLEPDRESAYVQEPFGLTLSVYSRQGVQMAGEINLRGMPESGLGELKWQEMPPDRQVISNAVYDVRRFLSRTRAVSAGLFEFAPVITVQMAVPGQNSRSRSPFGDPFFGSMFNRTETRPVDLPVEKTALEIKPLPEAGKPAGFSGAVGQFRLHVSAQPLNVSPGDPITLTIKISGTGNFDRVTAPPFPANGLFRLYGEPARKQEDQAVRFEQVVSPRTSDVPEIPELGFTFFDTQYGRYRTLTSAPIPITVTAASNSTAQVFAAKDSFILPPPETPFATESDLQRIERRIEQIWRNIRSRIWIIPTVFLAGLALFAGRKIHRLRRKDTARIRRQKAPKAARKALHDAECAQQNGDPAAFYDALWHALADYFGHRLNLPPGNVTEAIVRQSLAQNGVAPEQIHTLSTIFRQVEATRYGRTEAAFPEDMKKLQNSLEHLLKQCEKIKL